MSKTVKRIILAALIIAAAACIPTLHEYADAHRAVHGYGGEFLLPALVAAVWVVISQFRQLWAACEEDEDT